MAGVLDGLKVLDLSWGIAGPMAGMLLCDHGAEVTRIEPPGSNPFQQNSGYRVWNRGKRSAIFDLKREADRRLFHNLAAVSDVLSKVSVPESPNDWASTSILFMRATRA